MDIVAGSQNDEFYTPDYAIYPIIRYLKKGSNVWCPFDTFESNFVKILEKEGFKVYATHKNNGQDFFNFKVPLECDYIISNPPYSLKFEVLERLFSIKIPFAMLVGVVGLFESKKRFKMFSDNDFEIMYFDKRISYFKDFNEQKPSINPPFSSVYVGSGILPKQIMFERISSAPAKPDRKQKVKQ